MPLEFNPPPPQKIDTISAAIMDAVKNIPPDKTVLLVAVANEQNVNAALVVKTKNDWAIDTWIGKSWKGSLVYGAAVTKSW